jgi:spore coat protein CotH
MNFIVRRAVAILVGLLCAAGGQSLAEGATTTNSEAAILADLFAGRTVLRLAIQIPSEGMRVLSDSPEGPNRASARAEVREGGRVYTNVAIHLKGGAGSFRPIEDDPGFTLNFEKFAPGQSFHGLKKLSLNNAVQDPSFLNDKICRELFKAAGSPTPQAGFTTVQLNGRDLGIHILTEGFNKQFLRHYFTNVQGNLYQTHGNQEITQRLDVNSGDDPKNDSGLRALATAVREQDRDARWRKLGETLDLDRFLSFMSMEIMLCHWDGYCMNQNNYRVFHDLGANKIVFIAHGTDQMFGTGTMRFGGDRSGANFPILPSWHGAVAKAVMSVPEGRRLYLARLGELYTNLFHVDVLLKRVDDLSAVVKTAMTESGSPRLRNYQRIVDDLKAHIVARDKSLARQLAVALRPREETPSGPIPLSGWISKAQEGQPKFDQAGLDSHPHVLHISAMQGNAGGSWRTRVSLEAGTYRFEGEIRVSGVESANNGGGACLRTSSRRPRRQLTGDVDWRPFACEFQIEDAREVELVCELRALKGEAWFDTDKLQLVPVE